MNVVEMRMVVVLEKREDHWSWEHAPSYILSSPTSIITNGGITSPFGDTFPLRSSPNSVWGYDNPFHEGSFLSQQGDGLAVVPPE